MPMTQCLEHLAFQASGRRSECILHTLNFYISDDDNDEVFRGSLVFVLDGS
jgi:hypothetical protein